MAIFQVLLKKGGETNHIGARFFGQVEAVGQGEMLAEECLAIGVAQLNGFVEQDIIDGLLYETVGASREGMLKCAAAGQRAGDCGVS